MKFLNRKNFILNIKKRKEKFKKKNLKKSIFILIYFSISN